MTAPLGFAVALWRALFRREWLREFRHKANRGLRRCSLDYLASGNSRLLSWHTYLLGCDLG